MEYIPYQYVVDKCLQSTITRHESTVLLKEIALCFRSFRLHMFELECKINSKIGAIIAIIYMNRFWSTLKKKTSFQNHIEFKIHIFFHTKMVGQFISNSPRNNCGKSAK